MEIHRCHLASLRAYLGKPGSKGYAERAAKLHWQDESGWTLGECRTQVYSAGQ